MAGKIYTRTGDRGETSLVGGTRVPKSHDRLEVYGTVDELNAQLGVVLTAVENKSIRQHIENIQRKLFGVGTLFATDESSQQLIKSTVAEIDIAALEDEIDRMNDCLPQLQNFVLPSGCPAAAFTHVARTICRRAERLAVKYAEKYHFDPIALRYLNRLSDYLFVLSRFLNLESGTKEVSL